jgi:NADH/F420H2 dehydrogenase subunit C
MFLVFMPRSSLNLLSPESTLAPSVHGELSQETQSLLAYARVLCATLPGFLTGVQLQKNELSIGVHPEHLTDVLEFLRDSTATRYRSLMDIAVVDRPGQPQRFCVVYPLLSYSLQSRISVRTAVSETQSLPSVHTVYPAASWAESEAWDMYGIFFRNHPNLYRILTDYGFEGHPLRKDFPLTGFTEVRYDDDAQQVTSHPVELSQDFRYFDFTSPWKTSVK